MIFITANDFRFYVWRYISRAIVWLSHACEFTAAYQQKKKAKSLAANWGWKAHTWSQGCEPPVGKKQECMMTFVEIPRQRQMHTFSAQAMLHNSASTISPLMCHPPCGEAFPPESHSRCSLLTLILICILVFAIECAQFDLLYFSRRSQGPGAGRRLREIRPDGRQHQLTKML